MYIGIDETNGSTETCQANPWEKKNFQQQQDKTCDKK
jgi:hypothetical protein